jgi:serine/threonine-protein phosphatase CPPED1
LLPKGSPILRFVLIADPQFGIYQAVEPHSAKIRSALEGQGLRLPYYAPTRGLEREEELFSETVAAVNRIKPGFLAVCGDMVQKWDDVAQAGSIKEIADTAEVPVYWVPGNHDVAEDAVTPTLRAVETYRKTFGPDFYSFDVNATRFVVLNSTVLLNPDAIPGEFSANIAFLKDSIQTMASAGNERCTILSHHPWFLERADENEEYPIPMAIDPVVRRELLALVDRPDVLGVFATYPPHATRTTQAA